MTIIDDYLELQEEYVAKYGENTIVLMQIGHFYEAYAIDNSEEKTNSENVYRISDILNIQLTRKNKSIIENSRGNPIMIGVNLFSIDKYITLLLNSNYTTVIVDQVTEPPDPQRKVTGVFSPGTNVLHNNKGETNNLTTIYINIFSDLKKYKDVMTIGISAVDLTTGKSTIFETYSDANDINLALDEAYRFIQTFDPREIVVLINDETSHETKITNDFIYNYLDLSNRVAHFKREIDKRFFKNSYQSDFLLKLFPKHGLLSIFEYLDLERMPAATVAFIYLLDFAYDHNETIVRKLEKPETWSENRHLILTNNTINQLDLVPHFSKIESNGMGKYNSLYSIVNNTSTTMGKRLLKERLLNPIVVESDLNKRYDQVESLIENNFYKEIETHLVKIMDIERLHRKMSLGVLNPSDFAALDVSYEYVVEVLNLIKNNENIRSKIRDIFPSDECIQSFYNYISLYRGDLNLNEMMKYHLDKITDTFFNSGISSKIDSLSCRINEIRDIYKGIVRKFSKLIDENAENFLKLEHNDRDGYFISITLKRSQILKSKFNNMKKKPIKITDGFTISPNDITFKTVNKTGVRIAHDELKKMSNELTSLLLKIGSITRDLYLEKIKMYDDNYSDTLKNITKFISEIDVVKSNAKTACLYGYTRPIITTDGGLSNIEFKSIRHPIIERIRTDIPYVPNDVCFNNEDSKGILLFGTNAAGKSSLMKSIGLNIIMAQSGMFVAAETLTYKPYHYLFSRIQNNDNIFKGESSFAVEMAELRCILKRSNNRSLVLGDELCSGTESISAQSIFAASVVNLLNRGAHFIFATHLHDLCGLSEIKDCVNDGLKIFHLKVIFDKEKGKLVYDRKLAEGSGEAIYGLEVCKSLDMDEEFLSMANKIRRKITGIDEQILKDKVSKYNSEVYVDKCAVCKDIDAEDVHHINFQCNANENKIIDGYIQKDVKSNLVPLCKSCHIRVHNSDLTINGWIQTGEGIQLDYSFKTKEEIEGSVKRRKKYSDTEIARIKEMSDSNFTLKMASIKLEKDHGIKISSNTISKIWKNNY